MTTGSVRRPAPLAPRSTTGSLRAFPAPCGEGLGWERIALLSFLIRVTAERLQAQLLDLLTEGAPGWAITPCDLSVLVQQICELQGRRDGLLSLMGLSAWEQADPWDISSLAPPGLRTALHRDLAQASRALGRSARRAEVARRIPLPASVPPCARPTCRQSASGVQQRRSHLRDALRAVRLLAAPVREWYPRPPATG